MGPVEVMSTYVAAVKRGDFATAVAHFSGDVVLHIPGRSELAGERRGRGEVVAYFEAALARSHGASVDVELIDMLHSEERVALLVREVFHRESGAVEIRRANVYRVNGGQITEVWIFEADQYAVDALLAAPAVSHATISSERAQRANHEQ